MIFAWLESWPAVYGPSAALGRLMGCCVLVFGFIGFLTACSTHSHRAGAPDQAHAISMAEAGLLRLQEGDYADAKAYFQQALTLDGMQPLALLGMGSLKEREGEVKAALHWYSTALAQDPENVFALTNHGDLLCRGGDPKDGLAQLERAIERGESRLRTAAQVAAGTCALEYGDYPKAEAWLREALSSEPEYPEALLGMAQIALVQDRLLSSRAFISRLRSLGFMPPEAIRICLEVEVGLGNRSIEEICVTPDDFLTPPERIGMIAR